MSAPRSTWERDIVAEAVRDQATSTFTLILERLLTATPGAQAAALVDYEGETVDYVGRLAVYDMKITAAHWLIVMAEMAENATLGLVRSLTVRAHGRAYYMRRLEDGYVVVLILHPRAAFAVSERAMQEAAARLSVEAGWATPADEARWFWVDVESDHQGRSVRPRRLRVGGELQPIEVMGAMMGLAPREKGFRVRLPSGAEMMLVRERLGRWFADERIE